MPRAIALLLIVVLAAGVGLLLWDSGERTEDPTLPGDAVDRRSDLDAAAHENLDEASAAPGREATEATNRVSLEGESDGPTAASLAAEGTGSVRLTVLDPDRRTAQDFESYLGYRGAHDEIRFEWMDEETAGSETEDTRLRPNPVGESEYEFSKVEAGRWIDIELRGEFWVRQVIKLAPLKPGEERDLGEILLASANRIQGVVRGPDGLPVAEARVQLSSRTGVDGMIAVSWSNRSGPKHTFRTRSDAEGRYSLSGIPSGRYELEAERSGFVRAHQPGLQFDDGGEDRQIDLQLGRGLVIEGKVVGADGQALPDARVNLVAARGLARLGWGRERTLTDGVEVDAHGGFALAGLEEGADMRVAAVAPGHALSFSAPVVPGQSVSIRLRPAVSVEGRVLTADGEPVAQAELRMESLAKSDDHFSYPHVEHSGKDGSYRFKAITPGKYRLTVSSALGVLTHDPFEVEPRMDAQDLIVEGGSALVVQVFGPDGKVVPEAGLEVRPEEEQTESLDRIAVSPGGASITRSTAPQRFRATTDERGLARFLGLGEGSWVIHAQAEGLAPMSSRLVRKKRDEDQHEELRLALPAMVRAQVQDVTGQPVPQAELKLEAVDPEPWQKFPGTGSRRTDRSGLVAWTDLAPASYRLYVTGGESAEGMMLASPGASISFETGAGSNDKLPEDVRTLQLESGQTVEEAFVLAGQAIPKVYVSRFGEPVANAIVELTKSSQTDSFRYGGAENSARSDAQGWANFRPMKPGSYTLSARSGVSNPPTEIEVEVMDGPQELRIELATGIVAGNIIGLQGALQGAQVRLVPGSPSEDERGFSQGLVSIAFHAGENGDEPIFETINFAPGQTKTTSDPDGEYRFEDVPAGTYHVVIQHRGYSEWKSPSFEHDGQKEVRLATAILEAAGLVRGTVFNLPPRDPNSRFLSLKSINLEFEGSEGPSDFGHEILNAKGEFRFRDVPPGRYRLRYRGDEEPLYSDWFEVLQGETTHQDLNLP